MKDELLGIRALWEVRPDMDDDQMEWVNAVVGTLGVIIVQHGVDAIDDVLLFFALSGGAERLGNDSNPYVEKAAAAEAFGARMQAEP